MTLVSESPTRLVFRRQRLEPPPHWKKWALGAVVVVLLGDFWIGPEDGEWAWPYLLILAGFIVWALRETTLIADAHTQTLSLTTLLFGWRLSHREFPLHAPVTSARGRLSAGGVEVVRDADPALMDDIAARINRLSR